MKTVQAWKSLLRSRLRSAMRAGDRHALMALRETLAAIDNAEAQPIGTLPLTAAGSIAGSQLGLGAGEAPRQQLSPGAVLAVVENEMHERRDAAATYEQMGRRDEAQVLTRQAELLEELIAAPGPA